MCLPYILDDGCGRKRNVPEAFRDGTIGVLRSVQAGVASSSTTGELGYGELGECVRGLRSRQEGLELHLQG